MKKYFIILVMLISVLVLSGCSGNKADKNFEDLTDQVKTAGNINIKFRVPSGVISDALPDLITSFNATYPNVKVELDAVTGGYTEVRKITILDIQSRQAPTMVVGYPDHFAEYYNGNVLLNLQPYINGKNGFSTAELNDFLESYLNEGKGFDDAKPEDLYSLPFNKSTEVLVYNKTMMDGLKAEDAGIVVPKTWEEVKTVSTKINELLDKATKNTEEGLALKTRIEAIVNLAEGEKSIIDLYKEGVFVPFAYDSGANAFITMTRQWGGQYTQKVTTDKGIVKFNNAQNIEGLKYFQTEATAKRYGIAETFGGSYASDAFKALKTLMTVGSSAGVGYNKPDGGKFVVDVAEVPYLGSKANNKYVIQQGTNIAILKQSTNLERAAAWLLIKHLMTPENTAKFAMATGGYLPVKKSAYETDAYKKYLQNPSIDKISHSKAANVALSYINNGYKFFVDPAFVGSSTVRDEVALVFSAVMVNKANVEDRLTKAYSNLGKGYQE